MDATLMWAGVWTSVTVGVLLLVPLVVEFFKRNLPVLFGITMALLTMQLLAPHSTEIQAVWVPLSQMPGALMADIWSLLFH